MLNENHKKIRSLVWITLKNEIRQSLETLKEREKQVMKMYFGIDRDSALTLNEIGKELSLTREHVWQIKEKAIRRLRHRSRSKALFDNLDWIIINHTAAAVSKIQLRHIGIG
jgi:DNA-directed RNA polymerase sigma subunit (sigma70/sigma32)